MHEKHATVVMISNAAGSGKEGKTGSNRAEDKCPSEPVALDLSRRVLSKVKVREMMNDALSLPHVNMQDAKRRGHGPAV